MTVCYPLSNRPTPTVEQLYEAVTQVNGLLVHLSSSENLKGLSHAND